MDLEEEKIVTDQSKHKRLQGVLERALSFDGILDWPDYINFLGRLQKALQLHASSGQLSNPLLVSTRLAQCLNPVLPSGVHQKALETFVYVLQITKDTTFKRELQIWCPVIFPFYACASTITKRIFLSIIETYFIPLGESLRPCAKALITSLLPGLEEEGGDFFNETIQTLITLKDALKDEGFFWQCIWLAIIGTSKFRYSCVAYLSRHMPQYLNGNGKFSVVIKPDSSLMIQAFCCGLNDDNILVKRGFLDLLVQNFPLSADCLQSELSTRLILSAVSVTKRRDISLNRRLWAWFLNHETGTQDSQTDYFLQYGFNKLVHGLLTNITHTTGTAIIETCNLSLSLMDRSEIGDRLAPTLLIPLIEASRHANTSLEAVSSVSMLFNAIDPDIVWSQLIKFIKPVDEDRLPYLETFQYVITTFNIREEEIVTVHIPHTVCLIFDELSREPSSDHLVYLMKLAYNLTEHVPRRVYTSPGASVRLTEVSNYIIRYYQAIENGTFDAELLLHISGEIMLQSIINNWHKILLQSTKDHTLTGSRLLWILRIPFLLKESLLNSQVLSILEVLPNIVPVIEQDFAVLEECILFLQYLLSNNRISVDEIPSTLIFTFVDAILANISPYRPTFRNEAVELLWSLHQILGNHMVESAVTKLLVADDPSLLNESVQNFMLLWNISNQLIQPEKNESKHALFLEILQRPIIVCLDILESEHIIAKTNVTSWLEIADESFIFILDGVLCTFMDELNAMPKIHRLTYLPIWHFALSRLVVLLQQLQNHRLWLLESTLRYYTKYFDLMESLGLGDGSISYHQLIIKLAVKVLNMPTNKECESCCYSAVMVLQCLISRTQVQTVDNQHIIKLLTTVLQSAIPLEFLNLEIKIMDLLSEWL